MGLWQIIGFVLAVGSIAGLAIVSGMRGKKQADQNGSAVVAGVIMGTLVGGSSTIGTAQLAYNYGMSAWWFTLGGGLACLMLALGFAGPLRRQNCPTLVGMIRKEYGDDVGLVTSVLNSVGTFINIISQLLAASAVVLVIFPSMGTLLTVLISAAFMALYVVFGGTKGAGVVGILKLILLYVSMAVCGILAWRILGGVGSIRNLFAALREQTGVNYGSLFARGAGKDLGSCLSLILGVLTTQTYAQGILSGKTDRAARAGGLASAILIPPIGIFGILVGLYMRSVTDPAVFSAKTALTSFALQQLPAVPGGVVLGTLFIASVGTGAGLALGIATILRNDIIPRFTGAFAGAARGENLQRVLIVLILALASCLSTGSLGDTILKFAFMSMGLRGAVVFVPLCFSLWLSGKVRPAYAMAAVIAGPVIVLIFNLLLPDLLPFDPLFAGVLAALAIMLLGLALTKKK